MIAVPSAEAPAGLWRRLMSTLYESVILFGISLALQFTGPGLYSFDYGRSWARRPLVSSWIFILLAIAGAVALWWFGAGVNPLS